MGAGRVAIRVLMVNKRYRDLSTVTSSHQLGIVLLLRETIEMRRDFLDKEEVRKHADRAE
jgi:hypothetical protein